jgi:hypothetical protein
VLIAITAEDVCFRNFKPKQERLRPAVDLIASLQYLSALGNDAGMLMHVFSEGGSNKACELAEAYHTVTSKMLPVSALYLDSTPGHPRYLRLFNAINKSMPQVLIPRHAGLLFGSAVLGAIWVTYVGIKGYHNNVITRARRRVLGDRYFDLNAPRCYMYLKGDALIAWQDVQEHATNSAQMGMVQQSFAMSQFVLYRTVATGSAFVLACGGGSALQCLAKPASLRNADAKKCAPHSK